MKTILLTQKYEGWVGIIEVPDDLDLRTANNEFLAEIFPNTPFDNMSDVWWETYDNQVKAARKMGYVGFSSDSLFMDWLKKKKGVRVIDYETFEVEKWKYE